MATADDFLGLTKKGSQNLAEQRNLIWRLIRIDADAYNEYPTKLNPPEESRTDRICIEIDGGKVTKATLE